MTRKVTPIQYNKAVLDDLDDSIVLFEEPLQIVGTNERQWNGTVYDLNSTDVTKWDGIITQDHGSKLTDVIGKAIGLFKNSKGIYIRGIKYATNVTSMAVLAKNLLLEGFAPGFSCETIGPDPDENGIWRNHSLCGLSQVVHPNDKMAYAVISNSLEEAEKAGLDTSEIKEIKNEMDINTQNSSETYDLLGRKIKSIDFSTKVLYNNIMIDQIEKVVKNFNPWHDELGRFTFAPFGASTYVGYGSGSFDVSGNYVGYKKGAYNINADVATLKINMGYLKDSKGNWSHAEDLSKEDFTKALDASLKAFRDAALKEYSNRVQKATEAAKASKEREDQRAKASEQLRKLPKEKVQQKAKEIEKDIRAANPKAEKKIAQGKELTLTDFAKYTGRFSDDGNVFYEYAMAGTTAAKNGANSGYNDAAGRITKCVYDGETYLSGTTDTYGSKTSRADYDTQKAILGDSSVDDYNGVATGSVNYTDFYNKMVSKISEYQAANDLLEN